ncbi:PREDICTED: 39S ribosomal protein L32, mitochondrial [Ceratosolen solmsi marchali]|uniref:Large ribosomal subunit protein bL32m n=1 Tax=Ceratosolen solmsi marchali TaxID=326594 RepID=A0AAJ6YW56_9HYME|nr:PREDICTED: 39S ribosomal protein L32, mitochondrial [Ceratosolen solmsi marchali]
MAGIFVRYFEVALSRFENAIVSIMERHLQPDFCIGALNQQTSKPKFTIKNILNDGLLWAVPKHRRPLEKRLSRKFGFPQYNWKPLVPKTNLLMCKRCGHFHESYTICGHCYQKVKEESEAIHKAIDQLKVEPINNELVILYEGEKKLKPDQFWQGRPIVELPKKRPTWFHQNLLEPTTQKLSDSKEVEPNNLG